MWTFFFCGLVFLLYAWIKFKKKVFYPSVIFCFMWGMNCIFHFLIYMGYINPLTDVSMFQYDYMDTYIIFFLIATIIGFSFAHCVCRDTNVKMKINKEALERILARYQWVMWLNFFGGILRMVAMISLVGFSFSNVMDYRLAANDMMMSFEGGVVGWIFRISAYINMLAVIYIALAGLRMGMRQLKMKDTLKLFILYAPVQMATGGRLFILYFIIFYLGCFLLGRGISVQSTGRRWLLANERRTLLKMMILMMPLVVVISLSRGEGGVKNVSKYEGSFLDSFSYISDGTMVTDKCMEFYSGGKTLHTAKGMNTIFGNSKQADLFRSHKHTTVYASSVYTMIVPLFLDFGYWGSIIVWTFLSFLIEIIALNCLSKMTFIKFFMYAMLLKICYESVIANPFAGNMPFFELIVLLTIFYKPIFGGAKQQNL